MRLFYLLISIVIVLFLNDAAFARHRAHHKTRHYHANSTNVSIPSIYGAAQLNNELNYLINAKYYGASIAVYVKSMKYGDALYTRNINQLLTPASTMKILTAEAALIFLGPEYRFSTQLLTDAKSIKDGVLEGNLYVVLSGDPSLTYDDLEELMLSLRSHGVRAVAGNVYIDSTAYDQRFYGPGWIWKDKQYCYAAPISASIINHNCLSYRAMPARSSTRSRFSSSTRYFSPSASRKRYTYKVSYVVSDIPDYDRELFKNLLGRLSVPVYGNVTFASAPEDLSLVGQHVSKPLRLLINDMLKKSDNVIAGAIFKKLGQLYTHQPGSWENGSVAVSQILSRHAGVNVYGMRILDGSGLSPDNLASPAQMMQVLDFAYHHYPTSYEFISSLPIAGVDGTLKHRMWNIARKVRAKTGTISGVVGLAGYVVSAEKEPLAFVIMINGNKGMGWEYKGLEDRIATALTRYRR